MEEEKEEEEKKKLIRKAIMGSGGSGERVKRDEWSEGAVSTLLEAYEAKWVMRNRAKLKGHDWEDVARFVSSRANSTKSPKTQTQCKNKIESMKKRYRSESATATATPTPTTTSWPLYSRLDLLLRGTPPISSTPLPPAPPPLNSHGSNGVDTLIPKEDELGRKSSEHVSNKNPLDTDSSTPALYSSEKEKLRCNNKRKTKMESNKKKQQQRRTKDHEMEIAESIRWLAEVVVRSEQTRMDTMKEIERMRVEAEAKRGEMDLKRTEIIANTQLEIARIFASVNKGVDSSLRIGRS